MSGKTCQPLANSQDPYFSDWAAMGLSPAQGTTAFTGRDIRPLVAVSFAEKEKARSRERVKAKSTERANAKTKEERERAITEFKNTRMNGGALTESPEAKAKTARLIGRTNHARTQ